MIDPDVLPTATSSDRESATGRWVLLGVLAGGTYAGDATLTALLGTGLCGAFTTYSTFSYESLCLAEGGAYLYATLNAGLSVIAGLGAAFTGWTLAAAL